MFRHLMATSHSLISARNEDQLEHFFLKNLTHGIKFVLLAILCRNSIELIYATKYHKVRDLVTS